MAHTYTSSLHHCIFSTKERANTIPAELESRLWDFIGGVARQNGFKSLRVGGTRNHVHMLVSIPASIALAKAMQLIKGGSSKWMNQHSLGARFEWQEGYGAFSIGVSQLERTIAYIGSQKEHHQKTTFEEEYLAFLKKHGIEHDPKYVWG